MFQAISRIFKMLTQANTSLDQDVEIIIQALGGLDNIVDCGACATRLRLTLKSTDRIDQQALKQHGAIGVVCLDAQLVQVIYGLKANSYCQAIEEKRQLQSNS